MCARACVEVGWGGGEVSIRPIHTDINIHLIQADWVPTHKPNYNTHQICTIKKRDREEIQRQRETDGKTEF